MHSSLLCWRTKNSKEADQSDSSALNKGEGTKMTVGTLGSVSPHSKSQWEMEMWKDIKPNRRALVTDFGHLHQS